MLFFTFYALYSASINVDELKIVADGNYDTIDNEFQMNTYFKFNASFDGGYKFAAKVSFQTNTNQLSTNYINNDIGLGLVYLFFHSAEVKARNLADSHLDLSFWTGSNRYLGSGNKYRGYLYYPESELDDYIGFYRLRGTGVSTMLKFWEERFKANIHLYHNTNFITPGTLDLKLNFFSLDTEIGLYFEYIYFEIFGGFTKDFKHPYQQAELYAGRGKAGISFWTGNEHVQFFTTVGIPNLDGDLSNGLTDGTANLFDALYILGELSFDLFITENIISFLTRPTLYNEQETGLSTDFDLYYQLKVVPKDYPFYAGFKLNFQYAMDAQSPGAFDWHFVVAPYFSITLAGVIWDMSLSYDFAKIQEADATGIDLKMLEGFHVVVGVSSKF